MSAVDVLTEMEKPGDPQERGKNGKASSKSKDLSHVPCKFFRVGSCTAGSSCPFSHSALEPGQQKDVCAWFVKGNCKFGHKCALAHVLPGQSMAMDRRNKKAAQIAANAGAAAGAGGAQQQRERERDRDRERERDAQRARRNGPGAVQNNNGGVQGKVATGLLFGSTAPTRIPPSGARPPLPMMSKAAPAPAEPAPALKDADFMSYGSFANAAKGGLSKPQSCNDAAEAQTEDTSVNNAFPPATATSNGGLSPPPSTAGSNPFLATTPTKPHRFAGRQSVSTSVDFGPVGSPPRTSPGINPVRINGFSPGTSPGIGGEFDSAASIQTSVPQSTFSAPGTQTTFSHRSPDALGVRSDVTSNLGVGQAPFAVGSLPVLSRMSTEAHSFSAFADAIEDEDMEDFVPSSLKDLLTPEEQSRRMSRTSSTNPMNGIGASMMRPGTQQQLQQENRHRHSHSVPGTSMLSSDIRSIWADASSNDPNKGFILGMSPSSAALSTSPSFTTGARGPASHLDGPSPSMLHPSNASAAFLGMHHYMNREAPQHVGSMRSTSQGNVNFPQGISRVPSNAAANGLEVGGPSVAPSVSSSLLTTGRPAFDQYNSFPHLQTRAAAGAPPSAFNRHPQADQLGLGVPPSILSPTSRALQAHAPGQSLPQGLAAGYSRIHLQPPTAFSPASHGGLSDGTSASPSSHDWMNGTPARQQAFPINPIPSQAHNPISQASVIAAGELNVSNQSGQGGQGGQDDVGGLTSMFSHLSYSSVAASGIRNPSNSAAGSGNGQGSTAGPMSMSRRSSAQQAWRSHPLSSPLSGPVLTNDDDELFSFDEEK